MKIISRKMNIISRCSGLYRTAELSDTELIAGHIPFLFAVCRTPGLSQDQLARRLCFNKSTVTRRLAFLEEHGFITREADENDKRVMRVYPTEKTQAILPRLRDVSQTWNEKVTVDVSSEELEVFERVLDKIALRAKELVGLEDQGDEA